MIKTLVVVMVLGLCCSCAPSESSIQTAIAKTQASIPTQTSTPNPPTQTPAPTSTATAVATATPDIFEGSAQSITPGNGDLPDGFAFSSKGSGPSNVAGGNGYTTNFVNANNMFSMNGDIILVSYSVYVMDSEIGTVALSDSLGGNAIAQMQNTAPGPVIEPFSSVPLTIPKFPNSKAICGKIQGPVVPSTTCAIVLKHKNVVVWLVVAGNDTGGLASEILNQAVYFTSLVTQKLVN